MTQQARTSAVRFGGAYALFGRLDVEGALEQSPWAWGVLGLAVLIVLTSIVYIVILIRDVRGSAR